MTTDTQASPSPVASRPRADLPVKFLVGVLAALALTLALFYVIMRPPFAAVRAMTLFLSATAAISLAAGYAAYRLGWLSRSPRVGWTLMAIYGLASILTFINVWVTARLMFASPHDLMLATILLLFAGGIAMSLSYFLSSAMTRRMDSLQKAASAVAAGDLSARVEVSGRDELASLARSFNNMAAQLEAGAQRQQELDVLRRDLIAWAGHDLRTPLASIRAIVEALADGMVEDRESVERYLRTAQREVESLSALIDDLFELAQLDVGGLKLTREPVGISDLASDAIEGFSALANELGVRLQGSAEPGNDVAWIDGQKIERVLTNLIGNALRYTPAGGTVDIRVMPGEGEVIVSICDTGSGLNPDDLSHVFERFYRGEKSRSRATGGAGLGLAIAKGLVEAHDGRIWAESAPGQGACFYFALPR
jgi:two-component system sensor histidine kinase BaeS